MRKCPQPIALVLMLLLGFSACQTETAEPVENDVYIFLGHPYDWHASPSGTRIDTRLEALNFDQYTGVILGGDICSATTRDRSTVEYLDVIFDLSSPGTLWAVGNHDVRDGNTQWITEFTERPLNFVTIQNGVAWMVINTAMEEMVDLDDPCSYKDQQVKMIYNTLDTLSATDQLVMVMHHVVWGDVEPGMGANEAANALRSWYNFTCDSVVRFHTEIYPRILEAANRGLKISVISGDGGQYAKKYSYTTVDGIRFFISGINNSVDTLRVSPPRPFNLAPDSVLLIHPPAIDREDLEFEFVDLNELVSD